jgi:hypothetical protein
MGRRAVMASKKGAFKAVTTVRAAKVKEVKAAKHPTALDRRDHGGGPCR